MKSQTKANSRACKMLVDSLFHILILLFIFVTVDSALAAPAMLKWNIVVDNRVIGYRIYFGTVSKVTNGSNDCQFETYTPDNMYEINSPNITELPIIPDYFDLEPNKSYFFIIRSFDADNYESCDSNEKKYIVPSDYNTEEPVDLCPDNPDKTEPGECGCDQPDFDSDGDNVFDCFDHCPEDYDKTEPGACGCGNSDVDRDLDNVPDCNDRCPTDPSKSTPGTCGCNIADIDTDGDGTLDCQDDCPYDPNKTSPGICNCNVNETDSDADGSPDCIDDCPNNPDRTVAGLYGCEVTETPVDECPDDDNKTLRGVCGCGVADLDSDSDSTPDCIDECPDNPNKTKAGLEGCNIDECPNDVNKTEPGVCGCGVEDRDSDLDGILDCNDRCPNDPDKTEPEICGCGTKDLDSDLDGTLDCFDQCPNDPQKTLPESCGCGEKETDSDDDNTPDCIDECPNNPNQTKAGLEGCDVDKDPTDECPNDPNKTKPGVCGCGLKDLDSDLDGILDCNDKCPNDPQKTHPESCGCGEEETDSDNDNTPDCIDECPDNPDKFFAGVDGCVDQSSRPIDKCPNDPLKTEAGICGCGTEDTDSDNDNSPDCIDECPNDPSQTPAGENGCGNVDSSQEDHTLVRSEEIEQPVLYSPIASVTSPLTPVLTVNPFKNNALSNRHITTAWQIAYNKNFNTANLALDIISDKYLLSLKIADFLFEPATTYYWRVKFITDIEESPWSVPASFITNEASTDLDDNQNGIIDNQELNPNYDHNVDLDQNGISDIEQNDIKCLLTIIGDGQIGFKLAENTQPTKRLATLKIKSVTPDERSLKLNQTQSDPTLEYPFGLICFQLDVIAAGDNAKLKIFFSEPLPEGAIWYKNDIAKGWSPYDHVTYNPDGYSITIEVKDGGYGDFDGLANGTIVDPGGIAISETPSNASPQTDTIPQNQEKEDSGDSGGCFITTIHNSTMKKTMQHLIKSISVLLR